MTTENLTTDEVKEKIIVTVAGNDFIRDLSLFGLTFESTEEEVIDAIAPIILEEFGEDIRDTYKMRKSLNNRNIYCIPNSTAGM